MASLQENWLSDSFPDTFSSALFNLERSAFVQHPSHQVDEGVVKQFLSMCDGPNLHSAHHCPRTWKGIVSQMETDTHPCWPWNTVFKTTLGCQPYAMLLADIMFEKDILPDVVCTTLSKEKRVPRLAAAKSTTRFIPAPDETAVYLMAKVYGFFNVACRFSLGGCWPGEGDVMYPQSTPFHIGFASNPACMKKFATEVCEKFKVPPPPLIQTLIMEDMPGWDQRCWPYIIDVFELTVKLMIESYCPPEHALKLMRWNPHFCSCYREGWAALVDCRGTSGCSRTGLHYHCVTMPLLHTSGAPHVHLLNTIGHGYLILSWVKEGINTNISLFKVFSDDGFVLSVGRQGGEDLALSRARFLSRMGYPGATIHYGSTMELPFDYLSMSLMSVPGRPLLVYRSSPIVASIIACARVPTQHKRLQGRQLTYLSTICSMALQGGRLPRALTFCSEAYRYHYSKLTGSERDFGEISLSHGSILPTGEYKKIPVMPPDQLMTWLDSQMQAQWESSLLRSGTIVLIAVE